MLAITDCRFGTAERLSVWKRKDTADVITGSVTDFQESIESLRSIKSSVSHDRSARKLCCDSFNLVYLFALLFCGSYFCHTS